jgi:hypothetical protein
LRRFCFSLLLLQESVRTCTPQRHEMRGAFRATPANG